MALQCYCQQNDEDVKRMLKCAVCQRYFHLNCLKSGKPSQLAGDIFFHFTCVDCNASGTEKCERLKLLWLPVVILTLYNLQLSTTGKLGYYRWKEHICDFIDAHWVELFGSVRKKTQTWFGTVAGTLSTWCPTYFLSGTDDLKQSGWWKLADRLAPTVDILNATRVPKKAKPRKSSPDVASPQKVEGLRNRMNKSSIELAVELRAKRDLPVPSVKRRKTCESAARLFDSPLIDAAAAAADVDDDDDDVDDDDNDDDDDLCSEMTETDASQMSASSLLALDQSSQMSRSSSRSDWFTEKDLYVGDTIPEFLLKDEDGEEDEDDVDIDVDPCALSPTSELLWPVMSSAIEHDSLPPVDGESVINDVNKHVPGFSGMQKFERDFLPSDDSCMSPLVTEESTDRPQSDVDRLRSAADKSTNRPQSDVDRLWSEFSSEAEESDVGREKLSRRRLTKPTTDSVSAVATDSERLVSMSLYEEKLLLKKLKESISARLMTPCPKLSRFYRKLCVRQEQRERGIPVFDLDSFMHHRSVSVSEATENGEEQLKEADRRVTTDVFDDDADVRILDRYQHSAVRLREDRPTSFLSRLVGSEADELHIIHSPYTNRALKPFIRRDYESRPLRLRLLQEIVAYPHRHDGGWKPEPRLPIDYCYVRPHHIPAVNALCREYFWPGIDMTECLEYPDFSGIVLYRKLVIGFAFLVPDVAYNEAYISFIFTHPEWRRAGIGSFLLYHLIQTCMGKDVTLHVSASNPAMLLYQKFGFKAEELVLDFYDKYLPAESTECRHAYFLRLRR